uniref:rRNA methyltransferase 2, mitochondrial n=1 Tax=Kalanchoe fedtschenkoi TaxID=63787 RepID=A0A7N0TP40_KALFE
MSGAAATDFFYREAQRLGYVARSAFKLLQIQKQYKLINPGSSVLDLGCAPGAWLQVACQSLGPLKNGGVVVGIDVKKVKVPSMHCDSRVQTICGDVLNLPKSQIRTLSPQSRGFSVILSDMCAPITGIALRDATLSIELGMRALEFAVGEAAVNQSFDGNNVMEDEQIGSMSDDGMLQPGGNLLIKLLESEDIQELIRLCKPLFKRSSWLRPKATKSASREIYLVCQGYNRS